MFGRFRDYVGDESPQRLRIRYGKDLMSTGLWSQAMGVGGVLLARGEHGYAYWASMVVLVLGTVVLLLGCRRHVKAKGYYNRSLASLGLLSFVGVFVLLMLPDRSGPGGRRRGFDVVMPKKVSTTWVQEDDDPRFRPRPWADPENMARLWRWGRNG